MQRNKTLSNRLREVFINGKWIANTNYKDQLLKTNWNDATKKIGKLNSIAEITFHINYYLEGLLNVFNGGKLEISDKYSFCMSEISSKMDWVNLVQDLITNSEKFANKVEQMDDITLDSSFIDDSYGTNIRNIEAVIEHSYYHLGQITLLNKIISETKN